jgi:hypothetical protein
VREEEGAGFTVKEKLEEREPDDNQEGSFEKERVPQQGVETEVKE